MQVGVDQAERGRLPAETLHHLAHASARVKQQTTFVRVERRMLPEPPPERCFAQQAVFIERVTFEAPGHCANRIAWLCIAAHNAPSCSK